MVRIKVCGITNVEDLHLTQDLGADYVGFVFYQGSPRYIAPRKAREILEQSNHKSTRVGVFVNEKVENIRRIFHDCSLDIVQLHGEESPGFCLHLGLPCWKALRVRDKSSLRELSLYSCEAILLDAYAPHTRGGSGQHINPRIVASAVRRGFRIIAAGGISSENIREIIILKPYAVDLCSSLEENPGKKDKVKLQTFFEIANEIRGFA